MLKNYFITAIRNFRKNKSFTLLNIFGLGIGLASCLFVFTIINFENSFDNWHSKKDSIYRVVRHYNGDNGMHYGSVIPYPTGDALIKNIPDFEKVVQFHGPDDEKLSFTDPNGNFQIFREDRVLYADENYLDVFDFEILQGAPISSLKEPYKIYLTEKLAETYFKNQNPIGQIIKNENDENLEVVGIIQNPPLNTNLPFDCIVSMKTLRLRHPDIFQDAWGMTWAYTAYVLLAENSDIQQVESKMDEMMTSLLDKEEENKLAMKLQPLSEVHTDEKYGDCTYYVTPRLLLYAFSLLGFLLLGTAVLNFINLSTAQAVKRSKEVGIRKTLGGLRHQLISQFLMETMLIVIAGMLLAFTFGQLMISQFNSFLSSIRYDLSYEPEVFVFAGILLVLVTLLAGFYPSLILAKYRPIEALHNKINSRKGTGNLNLRRILVITQFGFTNLMLIATVIIARQMDFVQSKDLGFNFQNVVTIQLPDSEIDEYKAIKKEFLARSYVDRATLAFSTPQSKSNWNSSFNLIGQEYVDGNIANTKFADEDYLDFYELQLLAGTNIRGKVINDSTENVLVNRKLIKNLGWNDPQEAIGQWFECSTNMKIVGVLEDFNMYPLQREIRPAVIVYRPSSIQLLSLKLNSNNINGYMADMEDTFRKFYPNELFELQVLENEINDRYSMEDLLHKVVRFVALLSIILSSMGLYGLVSFMANQNAKNIGIRKVFGASTSIILGMFAREYSKLMIIAFILSIVPAWYLMNLWIEEFAYRIDISYSYFLIGFLASLTIAIVTVGYRSLRAAHANPIESLRHE